MFSQPLSFGTANSGYRRLHGSFRLSVPNCANLLGVVLAAQAANVEGSARCNAEGLTTSNGLLLTLSSRAPQPVVSTVLREVGAGEVLPATGDVLLVRGPVLRLETRP